jgi:hypothetical protein
MSALVILVKCAFSEVLKKAELRFETCNIINEGFGWLSSLIILEKHEKYIDKLSK